MKGRRSGQAEGHMQENLYTVKWILDVEDPTRTGFFGTTNHVGTSPVAAAIASAQSVSHAVQQTGRRAQLHILRVSDQLGEQNLLSAGDLQRALRYAYDSLSIDVVYRPLC